MSLLELDYSNCLADAIGATHGLTENELDTLIAKIPKHHEHVAELAAHNVSAMFDLPEQDLSELQALIKTHQKKWQHVIVIGIGGALIGAQCLQETLCHPAYNLQDESARSGPQMFFFDNADPHFVLSSLSILDLGKTLCVFISKSGITAEAIAFYTCMQQHFEQALGPNAFAQHSIVFTDNNKSPLGPLAQQQNSCVIDLPSNLGDRFNILGPPSLFIASLAGIDIQALLAGANDMKQRCWHGDATSNPAYMHAIIHYLLTRKRRKTIHASMGFSNRFAPLIHWYDHVLSVSLGKMHNKKGKAVHVGPSHLACIGPSGLHGQMQLYAEGPFDKVVTFLCLNEHEHDLHIPKIQSDNDAINYLSASSFSDMNDCAYITAAHCITDSGRPNMTIRLERMNEACFGACIFMLQLSTVMSAELYGIDAFDQPGVDSYKQGLFAQLGRIGFEDKADTLAAYRQRPKHTC